MADVMAHCGAGIGRAGTLAVAITLLHLRRVLRDEPRSVLFALVGLVVLGAILRLTISVEAPMIAGSVSVQSVG